MFLFFILLAQKFGKESFGEFSYYFTIASIIFVVFDLGGEFYQIREFTKKESLKLFHNILVLKVFLAIIVFLVAFYFSQPLYLLILIFSFFCDSLISLFRSSLYKNGQYLQESILTGVEKTVFILLALFSSFAFQSIVWMYLAFVAGKLVYLSLSLMKFYKIKYLFGSFRLLDQSLLKSYAFNSWSYVLHALLVIIFVQIDIVMLKHMGVPFEEIGLYSAAVKIYFTVVIFADIMFKQYYPKIASLIQDDETDSLRKYILKIQSTNIYASFVFSLLTLVFANEIVSAAFGSEFSESGRMLTLLSVIIVFRFSMYTYTAMLSSSRLNYVKLITSLTCVLANVGLNFILIPRYGVYGALAATVITEFILVALYKISSYKIVFTNYIAVKEILVLFCVFSLSIIFYEYAIPVQGKIFVVVILSIYLFINKSGIKKALSF